MKKTLRGEVFEEPSNSNVIRRKKYYRFNVYEGKKKVPFVSSARFTNLEEAQGAFQEFLKGDETTLFGNLGRYGVIASDRMF